MELFAWERALLALSPSALPAAPHPAVHGAAAAPADADDDDDAAAAAAAVATLLRDPSLLTDCPAADEGGCCDVDAEKEEKEEKKTEEKKTEKDEEWKDAGAASAARLLVVGVHALCVFLRENFCGPCAPARTAVSRSTAARTASRAAVLPRLLRLHAPHLLQGCGVRAAATAAFSASARPPAVLDGEFLLPCTRRVRFLGAALALFAHADVRRHCPSAAWWHARALLVHQRVRSGPSPTLRAGLDSAFERAEASVSSSAVGDGGNSDDALLRVALALERAQAHALYGQTGRAVSCVARAGEILGFSVELTGALGRRTRFQQDDVPQLVARAHIVRAAAELPAGAAAVAEADAPPVVVPAEVPMDAHSDLLLESPRLAAAQPQQQPHQEEEEEEEHQMPHALTPAEQTVLLSWALLVRQRSERHELTYEQALSFLERLVRERSVWAVQHACLRERSVIEGRVRRTTLRAEAQLESLVLDVVAAPARAPPLRARLAHFFEAWPVSLWALRREHADVLFRIGDVARAVAVFEALGDWEKIVQCYCALGKAGHAEELVRAQIRAAGSSSSSAAGAAAEDAPAVLPQRGPLPAPPPPRAHELPLLWSVLGELMDDPAALERSWEIAPALLGASFARPRRSLARLFFRRGDYARAAEHFDAALAVNPLFAEAWFALGCCRLRTDEPERAAAAFVRAASVDPEMAEAHNNLAAVFLRLGRKREAFGALREAWRHSDRSNWRVAENLVSVAIDVGEASAVADALSVLAREQPVRVTPAMLDALVPHAPRALLREIVSDALEPCATDPAMWGAIARFYRHIGEPRRALACAERRYRAARAREREDGVGPLVDALADWADHFLLDDGVCGDGDDDDGDDDDDGGGGSATLHLRAKAENALALAEHPDGLVPATDEHREALRALIRRLGPAGPEGGGEE